MAIQFDETNDYYTVSDAAELTLPDDDWCVGAWTYVADNAGSLIQNLWDNNYSTTPYVYLHLREASIGSDPNKWQTRINDGSFDTSLVSSTSPGADSTWRLVIVQRDTGSSEVQLWFCEVAQAAAKVASASDSGLGAMNCGDWYIATRADLPNDRMYGGVAAEFFKGNFALSSTEIAALADGLPIKSLAKGAGYTLDLYLPMWEADATLLDYSNSGNSAARTGAPTKSAHPPICTPIKRRRF